MLPSAPLQLSQQDMPSGINEIDDQPIDKKAHGVPPCSVRHPEREKVKRPDLAGSPIQPGYLSIKHAAAWADVSPRNIKRWIKAGLPTYQAGPQTKVLIKPGDIDAFLTREQVPNVDLDAMVEELFQCLKI